MKINKLYVNVALVMIGLTLVIYLAVAVVPQVLVTLTKATSATVVSLPNSYFIGGKLLAAADGKDFCVVNVFALDATGKGVKGRNVEITGAGLEVLTETTGDDGKASFQIKSDKEQQYSLQASIDGSTVGRTVTVTFRN
ncbi:MAG: Ig-like domain-containing protein [Candidatus Shapirobacteria bacterium]